MPILRPSVPHIAASIVSIAVALTFGLAPPLGAQPPPPAGDAVVALARTDTNAALDRFFYFDLERGDGFVVDRLRRDPISLRAVRLGQSLFTQIGRPRDQPAVPGEILLEPLIGPDDNVRGALFVETSTGYTAYFDALGKGGRLGAIHTTVGRPFADLAAAGGNFALLMRRAANGRTADAVLYDAGGGRALAIRDVGAHPTQPAAIEIDALPALEGRVSALSIARAGGGTDAFLLLDGGSGAIYRAGLDGRGLPSSAVAQPFGLFDVFARQAAASADPRFVAIPVTVGGQATRHALIVDVASGALAWLANVDGALAAPSLQALDSDIERYLAAGGDAQRTLTAVPRTVIDGATVGAWLIDGRSRIFYLDALDRPDDLRISPVAIDR